MYLVYNDGKKIMPKLTKNNTISWAKLWCI